MDLDFDLDEVLLDLDTAVPCGLALNELLTNAFKHTVGGGLTRVGVTVRAQGGELLVRVRDDGPGLPGGEPEQGTGMRLLHNLVALQLRGSVEFSCDPGTTATLRLPLGRDTDGFPLPSPRP